MEALRAKDWTFMMLTSLQMAFFPISETGISFSTSKAAPLYADLACSRHCETIFHRDNFD
jgi:hypothetical protein